MCVMCLVAYCDILQLLSTHLYYCDFYRLMYDVAEVVISNMFHCWRKHLIVYISAKDTYKNNFVETCHFLKNLLQALNKMSRISL